MYSFFVYICAMKNQNSVLKGSLNIILLKLLEENGAMYGYQICQKVKKITDNGIQITEGALYPALHKLEMEGIISFYLQEIEGRTRKYYTLTPEGGSIVQDRISEFLEAIRNVENILSLNLKPSI